MLSKVIFLVAALISIDMAWSRNLGRYSELDEEDHELLRAAYDAPSYHEEYQEDDDLKLGKVDLLKDGLWALKAKVKELKAFDKALVANLLSTKLKMKDMLENHLGPLKNHHHPEPVYHAPAYQAPHYHAPAPHYSPPPYQHASPISYAPTVAHFPTSHQYGGATNQYASSSNTYGASNQNGVAGNQYGVSGNQNGVVGNQHGVSSNQYSSAANQYSSSSAGQYTGNQIVDDGNQHFSSSSAHDPYYGN